MKFPLTRFASAMTLAALSALHAQDEPRPPKAEPVPEEETAPAETVPAQPAGAPKAEVIPEDNAPIEESSPAEPWEDPDVIRQRKAKEKAAEEKAKAAQEAEAEARRKMETEEAKEVRAVPNGTAAPDKPAPREVKPEKPKIALALKTDPNAKPLSLRVPAPRGLIVDRNGEPFAQNKVAHYIGVQLPMKEGLTDVQILDFARGPLAFCQAQLNEKWT